MKKFLLLLVSMALIMAILGCSGKKNNASGSGGPDSIRMMITQSGGGISDWANNSIFQAIEKATNTKIEMEFVEYEGFPELLTTAAASGTFPDMASFIFHGSKTFLQTLVENDIIAAYEGDVAAACPEIIKRYAENPSLTELKINGKIYFQPLYWGNKNDPNIGLIHIRKDIIDKYGLKIPDTWDEYLEYLRTCVKKEGIYGVTFNGQAAGDGLQQALNVYLGSYSIPYVGWYKDDKGNYQYWLTAEHSSDAIVAFRRLFAEGLVDPNVMTYNEEMLKNSYISGRNGSMIYNGGGHIGRTQNDFALVNPGYKEYVTQALDCGGGSRGYTQEPMFGQLNAIGGTPYNNPVAAARIVNFLQSAEGEQLTAIGIEGEDWRRENGNIVCLEAKYQHGFPREAGVNGAHPLSAGIVSWQSQAWQDFNLLYGKDEAYNNWYKEMRDNQCRYQVPAYGIMLTTPEWSDFQAVGNDLLQRAIATAWHANSDDEARRIWTNFVKEWVNAGGLKASATVEKILKQMYG
ncbi:extracellular solute-binding protein [Leadbettera azotonutricia]|uniref:Bacterial extracellular solute-binding protein n=1 Tax=Leadbettera azotonutricia (strain ATCC BAA-888 / DSM 13862 / ZAS-9) TaxID=545695 RepID=F5YDX9_LEAAZ|nr:extracellular solute-binding protein [Leadbettera azotonutricia]AEF80824.1 bacterial extracellular solute-binding protein [Leadbettera azotonutricia ZAS-9]